MANTDKLLKEILKFRDARNWKQFHNPKDLAISLVLEAGEVLEHFQWKSKEEVEEYVKTHKDEISYELVDVLVYLLTMVDTLDIDIEKAFKNKMKMNAKKYPVKKAKGKHTKYNKL